MCVQVMVSCNFLKMFYSCTVLKKKNALKSNFQNIPGNTNVKATAEDFSSV